MVTGRKWTWKFLSGIRSIVWQWRKMKALIGWVYFACFQKLRTFVYEYHANSISFSTNSRRTNAISFFGKHSLYVSWPNKTKFDCVDAHKERSFSACSFIDWFDWFIDCILHFVWPTDNQNLDYCGNYISGCQICWRDRWGRCRGGMKIKNFLVDQHDIRVPCSHYISWLNCKTNFMSFNGAVMARRYAPLDKWNGPRISRICSANMEWREENRNSQCREGYWSPRKLHGNHKTCAE